MAKRNASAAKWLSHQKPAGDQRQRAQHPFRMAQVFGDRPFPRQLQGIRDLGQDASVHQNARQEKKRDQRDIYAENPRKSLVRTMRRSNPAASLNMNARSDISR